MTEKQYRLFVYIKNQLIHNGKAPTFKDMKKFMCVTSNQTIEDWLKSIEKEGLISRTGTVKRKIVISKLGRQKPIITRFVEREFSHNGIVTPTVYGTVSNNFTANPTFFSANYNLQTSPLNIEILIMKRGEKEGT